MLFTFRIHKGFLLWHPRHEASFIPALCVEDLGVHRGTPQEVKRKDVQSPKGLGMGVVTAKESHTGRVAGLGRDGIREGLGLFIKKHIMYFNAKR